jgi:hypothetical protein
MGEDGNEHGSGTRGTPGWRWPEEGARMTEKSEHPTEDEVRQWWLRQGMPEKITDPVVLSKIITLASPEIYMTDEELEELRRRRAAEEPRRRRRKEGTQ